MMFETSKHAPKTEKRCCVFKYNFLYIISTKISVIPHPASFFTLIPYPTKPMLDPLSTSVFDLARLHSRNFSSTKCYNMLSKCYDMLSKCYDILSKCYDMLSKCYNILSSTGRWNRKSLTKVVNLNSALAPCQFIDCFTGHSRCCNGKQQQHANRRSIHGKFMEQINVL